MSAGQIAMMVNGVLCVLLFAHLIVLPLIKRRPVLLRGREAWLMVSLISLELLAFVSWMIAPGALIVAAVSWWLRPWLVFGVSAEQVMRAAEHAGGLIRFRIRRVDARTIATGKTGTIRLTRFLGTWLKFAAPRTPKLALFQNVLRKSIENYRLGDAAEP